MPRFLTHLPCSGGQTSFTPLHVHEITLARSSQVGRGRIWHETIQPEIAQTPSRPDADWNWRRIIPVLTFVGAHRRGGRIFQMTVGPDEKPAAMVAILETERWYADTSLPATFLWFLSTAPAQCLSIVDDRGVTLSPKLIGRAAFDIAVTIARESEGKGRLWLHADPKGGSTLMSWYTTDIGMSIVDPSVHPRMPGDPIRGGRPNDGRYLFLDEHDADVAYRAMSQYRR